MTLETPLCLEGPGEGAGLGEDAVLSCGAEFAVCWVDIWARLMAGLAGLLRPKPWGWGVCAAGLPGPPGPASAPAPGSLPSPLGLWSLFLRLPGHQTVRAWPSSQNPFPHWEPLVLQGSAEASLLCKPSPGPRSGWASWRCPHAARLSLSTPWLRSGEGGRGGGSVCVCDISSPRSFGGWCWRGWEDGGGGAVCLVDTASLYLGFLVGAEAGPPMISTGADPSRTYPVETLEIPSCPTVGDGSRPDGAGIRWRAYLFVPLQRCLRCR